MCVHVHIYLGHDLEQNFAILSDCNNFYATFSKGSKGTSEPLIFTHMH